MAKRGRKSRKARKFYAKARKSYGRARSRVRRFRKSHPIPLGAKIALGLGFGAPVAATVITGAKAFFASTYPTMGADTPDLWGRAAMALGSACDDFTTGWGFGETFSTVNVSSQAGVNYNVSTRSFRTMPAGGSMKLGVTAVTATGLTLAVSWLARKITGAKQVKIAGQTIA